LRACARSGHPPFRIHDIRHAVATRYLAATDNMAAVSAEQQPGARPIQSLLGVGNGPAPPPTGAPQPLLKHAARLGSVALRAL
jgi:hypothetical protein